MLRHRRSPNFYAFYRLLHVMDAQDVGTLHQRDGVKHRCAIQRLLGRGAQQSVYHRFPGDAYQHGQVQHLHALQFLHHGIVLFQRLAEAETWVGTPKRLTILNMGSPSNLPQGETSCFPPLDGLGEDPTSLIMSAPNSSTVMRATSGRKVSIETTASGASRLTMPSAKRSRSISSDSDAGSLSGRVEQAPTSMMVAPSSSIWCVRSAISCSVCILLPA